MADIEIVLAACRSIEAAGIRTFNEKHIPVIQKDTAMIDDKMFKKISNEYLEHSNPPRNMTGFFKARYYEEKKAKEMQVEQGYSGEEFDDPAVGIGYHKCINLAMRLGNSGIGFDFEHFRSELNEVYERLIDNEKDLLLYLRNKYRDLIDIQKGGNNEC